jgi:hypothetical protein
LFWYVEGGWEGVDFLGILISKYFNDMGYGPIKIVENSHFQNKWLIHPQAPWYIQNESRDVK